MDENDYRRIFVGVCEARGVPFDEAAFGTLVKDYHEAHGQPLLACYRATSSTRSRTSPATWASRHV